MSSARVPQEWQRTQRHPELAGDELDHFEMEDGGRCIYDSDNPEAYLIGEAVEVGTDTQAHPALPRINHDP